jgi:hypothetical protein
MSVSEYASFTDLIGKLLSAEGFERRGKAYWYRFEHRVVIVVNLQKSAHGAGVYINFGLAFLTGRRRRYPRDYKCAVYGRNPALSADEFAQF